jgi:tetratricopeptide (TPR) repeat protein
MPRPGALAAAALVAVLAVSVAAPSLRYGFVYDDEAVVLERKPFWEFGPAGFLESRPWGTGRHLTAVSLDLDRLAGRVPGGTDPAPFHRTNLLLSALLSVLVLALLSRVGLSPAAALAGAALFAVHPVHVDSVAWIVGRAELLTALGVVGAVLLAIRPDEDRAKRRPLAVAAGTALLAFGALHSKENALVLPLLLLLARFFLGPRVALAPALAGSAVAIALWGMLIVPRMSGFAQPQFVDNPLVYAPFLERVPKALAILWNYAWLTVWPHPLLPDRSWAQTDPGLLEGWIAAAAWIGAAALAWRMRHRAPRAAFAAAWFPAAFTITANVASPIGLLMAERLMLLPSVSAALLAGLAFERFATTPVRSRVAVVATTVVVSAFFLAFQSRAAVWESNDVYFAASAAASPRSAKAWYDLGNWQLRSGRRLEAEAAYERALAIVPSLSRAAQYLAESKAKRGDAAGGAEVYLKYLETTPDDAGAVKNTARLLLQAGRMEDAERMAQRLVELKPGDADAIESLVSVQAVAKREAAKAETAKAVRPETAEPVRPETDKPAGEARKAPSPVSP